MKVHKRWTLLSHGCNILTQISHHVVLTHRVYISSSNYGKLGYTNSYTFCSQILEWWVLSWSPRLMQPEGHFNIHCCSWSHYSSWGSLRYKKVQPHTACWLKRAQGISHAWLSMHWLLYQIQGCFLPVVWYKALQVQGRIWTFIGTVWFMPDALLCYYGTEQIPQPWKSHIVPRTV